jgi:hypothetical protein
MTMPLDFSTMISSAQRGEVLTPIVHRKLFDPSFEGFNVLVESFAPRAYDGKFHPSGQSLYSIRQLYLYLTRPEQLSAERMELIGVLAVTAGKFWHNFLQNLWLDDGIMIRQRTDEEADRLGINPAEVKVRDDETNRVGHADGELTNGDVVEIKSINDFQVHKVDNELILKEKKPQYWAQTQDYLDILDRESMRYFTIAPSYPYPTKEFVVKADKHYQARRRGEYLRALDMASRYPDGSAVERKDPVLMSACCAPKSKQASACFARLACPVGRYSK